MFVAGRPEIHDGDQHRHFGSFRLENSPHDEAEPFLPSCRNSVPTVTARAATHCSEARSDDASVVKLFAPRWKR